MSEGIYVHDTQNLLIDGFNNLYIPFYTHDQWIKLAKVFWIQQNCCSHSYFAHDGNLKTLMVPWLICIKQNRLLLIWFTLFHLCIFCPWSKVISSFSKSSGISWLISSKNWHWLVHQAVDLELAHSCKLQLYFLNLYALPMMYSKSSAAIHFNLRFSVSLAGNFNIFCIWKFLHLA